jgi:hypothetical protein
MRSCWHARALRLSAWRLEIQSFQGGEIALAVGGKLGDLVE